MASTYSTSLKIQLMGNGEDSGTWGSITNTNWNLIEQAVSGVQNITMANANYTLTDLNGVSDEARNMVLVVGGTNSAIYQIVAPLAPKFYVVTNSTSGGYAITIGGSSGSIITIPNGTTVQVYCNGTNFYSAQTSSAGNFNVNGNLTVSGTSTLTGAVTASSTLNVTGLITGSAGISTTTGSFSGNLASLGSVSGATGVFGAVSGTTGTFSGAVSGTTITASTQFSGPGTGLTGTASSLTVGTATNATNATYASNPASGGSFVTSLNIGSQSVSYASTAGNAATATNPQSGGSFVTSSNISSQSVNYANSAGSASTVGLSQFASSQSTNGYQYLPSGVIIQWGQFTSPGTGMASISFPITFPNTVGSLNITSGTAFGGSSSASGVNIQSLSTSGATFDPAVGSINKPGGNWMAIGW